MKNARADVLGKLLEDCKDFFVSSRVIATIFRAQRFVGVDRFLGLEGFGGFFIFVSLLIVVRHMLARS